MEQAASSHCYRAGEKKGDIEVGKKGGRKESYQLKILVTLGINCYQPSSVPQIKFENSSLWSFIKLCEHAVAQLNIGDCILGVLVVVVMLVLWYSIYTPRKACGVI